HAAVLLFGKEPQRFLPSAEVKCVHFHGIEIRKPIPSYQIYGGTIFDQVDQAVDFVMAKLTRSIGTRSAGPEVPVEYEIPKEVVSEAIVNAVAHRDYTSNAGVQVMLFADRLEVWNPGELPPSLTPERLREPHASIPRNPLIAEPLYLAHYIEKVGTGTLDMIERCREAGLPEPDFEQRAGQFVVTLWRDWLTDKMIKELDLNERQKRAISYVRQEGRISNTEYQTLTGVAKRTAHRDLADLVEKRVFQRVGKTGKGTFYELRKGARKGPNGL
ncbi:MAG: transcriptional regulator, partial [Deltaproteobacteria bacterium]